MAIRKWWNTRNCVFFLFDTIASLERLSFFYMFSKYCNLSTEGVPANALMQPCKVPQLRYTWWRVFIRKAITKQVLPNCKSALLHVLCSLNHRDHITSKRGKEKRGRCFCSSWYYTLFVLSLGTSRSVWNNPCTETWNKDPMSAFLI